MSNNNYIGALISWIWSIGLAIFNVIVFIQYLNQDISLLTISGILNIIDIVFFSKGKGLAICVPIFIGAWIAIKNIWSAMCLALLMENVLSFVFGIVLLIYTYSKINKNNK